MCDNWGKMETVQHDDDFEPEVHSLAPHPPPPPVEEDRSVSREAPTRSGKTMLNMESFSRELSAAEREEIQRREDLALTLDMFGEKPTTGDERPYSDIVTKDEFEDWGLKVGTFLASRHKAAHYGDMLNKLIQTVSEKLNASEIRTMSNYLKTIADSKKAADKVVKSTPGQKKAPKASLKVGKGSVKEMYADYNAVDDYDNYSDYDDNDFM
ncbi:hypothetical protein DICVIV_02160 [Dictyocaulus viviparus]|uniref:Uncharacterized protein n=1 Tax=Dictyocaulus viviparus TaxID=29172 RepID=A0A0D8Y6K7_DICVI|nr:hypothetical protein DICVIV_02160 [Dictyocaulus viviparus]